MTAEPIRTVSVAEAKAHLSELLKEVEDGEVISITRRGEPIATLNPVKRPRKPVDLEWLRSITDQISKSEVSAGDLLRQMRDGARY